MRKLMIRKKLRVNKKQLIFWLNAYKVLFQNVFNIIDRVPEFIINNASMLSRNFSTFGFIWILRTFNYLPFFCDLSNYELKIWHNLISSYNSVEIKINELEVFNFWLKPLLFRRNLRCYLKVCGSLWWSYSFRLDFLGHSVQFGSAKDTCVKNFLHPQEFQ